MSFGEILLTLSVTIVSILLLLFAVVVFNALKSLRLQVEKSAANIEVLLKQRFDEVPRLVEICKAYLKHEATVLERLTALRSNFQSNLAAMKPQQTSKTLPDLDALNKDLTSTIGTLNQTVEAYPDLKASAQFLYIQKRLSELEDQLADRREYYNQTVAQYQTQIESFPDLLIAQLCRFPRKEFLQLSEK